MGKDICHIYGTRGCKVCGWIILVIGFLFLLQDTGRWAFWNLSWYTVVFLLVGICGVAHTSKK